MTSMCTTSIYFAVTKYINVIYEQQFVRVEPWVRKIFNVRNTRISMPNNKIKRWFVLKNFDSTRYYRRDSTKQIGILKIIATCL